MIVISNTGFHYKDQTFIVNLAVIKANTIPIKAEFILSIRKSTERSKGVTHVKGSLDFVLSYTALKMIILTASFVIPSPNTIEYKVGC